MRHVYLFYITNNNYVNRWLCIIVHTKFVLNHNCNLPSEVLAVFALPKHEFCGIGNCLTDLEGHFR